MTTNSDSVSSGLVVGLRDRLARYPLAPVPMTPEALAALLDVAEAGAIFAENHGGFHPDFWAAGRRGTGQEWCASCDFGKAFTGAFPQCHPEDGAQ